jgi:hypothetical protein
LILKITKYCGLQITDKACAGGTSRMEKKGFKGVGIVRVLINVKGLFRRNKGKNKHRGGENLGVFFFRGWDFKIETELLYIQRLKHKIKGVTETRAHASRRQLSIA